MKQHSPAVHHSIVVTDIEKFSDPARTNLDQLAIRHGHYKVIRQAFSRAHVDWDECTTEDRGDGVLVLVPSNVPKVRLAASMLSKLGGALREHNASCSTRTRFRLRIALHAGEVHHDSHGVAGTALNHAFRLAEAPALKAALRASPGVLAVIVSDWFYGEVVRHYPATGAGSYRRVRAVTGPAWVRVEGVGQLVQSSVRMANR